MNKEESLSFLESCIKMLEAASEGDRKRLQAIYNDEVKSMRNLTKEERNKYIELISEPTNINFFDLIN